MPAFINTIIGWMRSEKAKLARKLGRDTTAILVAFFVLVVAFYGLRRLDGGATVDGFGALFVAMQVLLIGFAAASTAAVICRLLFDMLGRTESKELCAASWRGWATVVLWRLTWLGVFWLLFSRSLGH